jgi:hypothetical protein
VALDEKSRQWGQRIWVTKAVECEDDEKKSEWTKLVGRREKKQREAKARVLPLLWALLSSQLTNREGAMAGTGKKGSGIPLCGKSSRPL